MNSRQRRTKRRAAGVRPPFPCVWCRTMLNGLQDSCSCMIDPRPRKMWMDYTLEGLATKGWERGWEFNAECRDYTELERLALQTDYLGFMKITLQQRQETS